jgi:hypothetical protein
MLTPVVRSWLKSRPDPGAHNALLENINSVFWIIEDEYLSSAEGDEADLLAQLNVDLQSAALSLSELQNSDARPRVQDLAETHTRLLDLHGKLKEVLRSVQQSSA